MLIFNGFIKKNQLSVIVQVLRFKNNESNKCALCLGKTTILLINLQVDRNKRGLKASQPSHKRKALVFTKRCFTRLLSETKYNSNVLPKKTMIV